MAEYSIHVVTGTSNRMYSYSNRGVARVTGAGTDANVFITLYGDKGNTRQILLDNKNRDDFESGSRDQFKVKAKDVGKLTKIRLRHDNRGGGAGWYLESITVNHIAFTGGAEGSHGQWFAKDEGDGKIDRFLYRK